MYSLIISNPPHQDEVDAELAAPSFGLTPADVRMKATYGAPEIWVMSTVRSKIEDAARTLREAGLNIVIASGEDLAKLPAAATVKSFSFTDTYLVAKFAHGGFDTNACQLAVLAAFTQVPEHERLDAYLDTVSLLCDSGKRLKPSHVEIIEALRTALKCTHRTRDAASPPQTHSY